MKAKFADKWFTVESINKEFVFISKHGQPQGAIPHEQITDCLSDAAYDQLQKREQKALECREINEQKKSQEIHEPVIIVSQVPVILETVNNS